MRGRRRRVCDLPVVVTTLKVGRGRRRDRHRGDQENLASRTANPNRAIYSATVARPTTSVISLSAS